MKYFKIVLFVVMSLTLCTYAQCDLWVRGNTHAHSTISDGDVSPEEVAKWYKNHGYQFVFLTDHYSIAPEKIFASLSSEKFVVIPGYELNARNDLGRFAVHGNALGTTKIIKPVEVKSITATLLNMRRTVVQAGGIFQINHPSFSVLDTQAITRIPGPTLIEIYNHGVAMSQYGILGNAAFEQTWDEGLTAGRQLYGVAADDAHDYHGKGKQPPGGGWIYVKVKKLTEKDILTSLKTGRFYASTGVQFEQCMHSGNRIIVKVKKISGKRYSIRFIGRGGCILDEKQSPSAIYNLRGSKQESYVRVKVTANTGECAWSQPLK